MSAVGRRTEGSGADILAEMLEPCAPGEFLDSSWGVNFLHVRGRAGRFARLMPWGRLSEIITRQRLDFPRLRLVRDGKPVPVSSYLRHATGGRQQTAIPRLKSVGLARELRGGA